MTDDPGSGENALPDQAATPTVRPRPVTRPWSGAPGVLFSWEVAYARGSAWGITRTEQRAIDAVTDALHEHGGRHGIVQEACLGVHRGDERDQYCYGRVVARAVMVDGMVQWVTS